MITDWFMLWLSPFIEYCKDKDEVKREYLVQLREHEFAQDYYEKWVLTMRKRGLGVKQVAWSLTYKGMFWYGAQLTFVELMTVSAIYLVRLIIDYFHTQKDLYVPL